MVALILVGALIFLTQRAVIGGSETAVKIKPYIYIVSGQSTIKWCAISQEMAKCKAMAEAFSSAAIRPTLRCIPAASVAECAQKLMKREADAFSAHAQDIYEIGKQATFKIAAAETNSDGEDTTYYAVAVVKRANSAININSLKGKKSCHTGLDRTAGWKMPVGYLIDSGRMSVLGCNITQGLAEFFSASCVPGAIAEAPSLCQLCGGDGFGSHKCEMSSQEKYYSYNGAFRCLVEDAGDVAFVKHTTVTDNTDGKGEPWAQGLHSEDYQLLCPDGTRSSVSNYAQCHVARVPSRGIVVQSDIKGSVVYFMLKEGLQKSHFQIFSSMAFNGTNLLFSDNSAGFILAQNEDYITWMGWKYYNILKTMDCSSKDVPEFLRWCVLSYGEQSKCSYMAEAFKSKELIPYIQCVYGTSVEDCMQKIQNKEADAINLDGGYIYTAGKNFGLVPAAGESYTGDGDGSTYYAVAVVKRSNKNIQRFDDLRGQTSCHTGYGRTAGWNIPIGLLIEKGLIRLPKCQIAQGLLLTTLLVSKLLLDLFTLAVGDFFRASCVPGANEPGFPSNLCSQCIGDSSGQNKCVKGQDRFDGYSGAFR
ncbi:hypothetical protein P4O66_009763 [Electrophorus voltai]|uniref:Melanotransferrin n=1 Tax=Electrophorus voltai TaxID=2609070 RepID=A0AAD8ZEU1_9TELE|nr:hypothetical protein P4O66_009763 [Electrophorus voltai]